MLEKGSEVVNAAKGVGRSVGIEQSLIFLFIFFYNGKISNGRPERGLILAAPQAPKSNSIIV